MTLEMFREHCRSLPSTTEQVQWGADLVFKIGGKMFAVAADDPRAAHCASFRCTPEEAQELVEREGIDPAPYLARYHWVALKSWDALSNAEITRLVKDAYGMVRAGLPKKVLATLCDQPPAPAAAPKRTTRPKKPGRV